MLILHFSDGFVEAEMFNSQQNEAAKEFEERHKQDVEKVKEMDLEEWVRALPFKSKALLSNFNWNESLGIRRYRIRGDEDEWDEALKKAGNTAIVSIKRCSPVWKQRSVAAGTF